MASVGQCVNSASSASAGNSISHACTARSDGPPAAEVAREQLKYSVAELSTHDNQRVTKALNDNLQAALAGTKSPADALKDAQRESDRILRSWRH